MQITGFDLYTGATITRVFDGSGAEYIACCAKKHSNGVFGFYIFRNGVEVPYSPFCSARGSISSGGNWIAGNGADLFFGSIPGFVPYAAKAGPAGPQGAVGPKGDTGPQGPAGPAGSGSGGLSTRYTQALERLCVWLGIQ
jgi:hypothetical protein